MLEFGRSSGRRQLELSAPRIVDEVRWLGIWQFSILRDILGCSIESVLRRVHGRAEVGYGPGYASFGVVWTKLGDLDACAVRVARRIWLVRVGWLGGSKVHSPYGVSDIASRLLAWPGF